MEVIKPPRVKKPKYPTTMFLAGSIEMGSAVDWQSQVQESLKDRAVSIFNPRRDDWDSSWEQSIFNHDFRAQVEWEMAHLEAARYKVFYFAKDTKAPITLLELGLMANKPGIMVCCPNGFWRKGNVDIVCKRYNIPTYTSLDQMMAMSLMMI